MLAKQMHWDLSFLTVPGYFDPKNDNHRRYGLLLVQLYAVHLGTGNSIHCKSIKVESIKQYVLAIRKFMEHFTAYDFGKHSQAASTLDSGLLAIFEEFKAYDSRPNRREPYTLEMHAEVCRRAEPLRQAHSAGKIPALCDWFECGLYAGLRNGEWAQPTSKRDPLRPALHETKKPKPSDTPQDARHQRLVLALLAGDIRVETHDHRRAVGLDILKLKLSDIAKLWIRFRSQKNGDDGEEKLFTRNPNETGSCFVASMYRILSRFALLKCDPLVTPLGAYQLPNGLVQLITSDDIEWLMRDVAKQIYQLNPATKADKEALQRWSAHSLRVGATVLLHGLGFSPTDIKFLLRWRSEAFMLYLRNLAVLARRHNSAIDSASAMPHFV